VRGREWEGSGKGARGVEGVGREKERKGENEFDGLRYKITRGQQIYRTLFITRWSTSFLRVI
jgi:hypothetical protein